LKIERLFTVFFNQNLKNPTSEIENSIELQTVSVIILLVSKLPVSLITDTVILFKDFYLIVEKPRFAEKPLLAKKQWSMVNFQWSIFNGQWSIA